MIMLGRSNGLRARAGAFLGGAALAAVVAIGAPGPGATGARAEAQEAGAGGAGAGPVVDATLDSMRGGQRTLRDERGRRVVVLFYEDRPHVEDNDTLKGELRRYIVDNGLGDRLVAYGVANLADVGSVPQALVRSMIAPLVDRWGSDILLDWEGVMRREPFSFRTAAANVAIVDRDGRIVYRHAGPVDDTARREFYRALRGALR